MQIVKPTEFGSPGAPPAAAGLAAVSVLARHRVTVSGREGPAFVFANGFASDQHAWDGIRPWVDRLGHTYAFDCGDTGDAFRYATLDGQADDLLDVLDAAGVRRCTLIGHEAGAMAGVLAALKAPERFERLVLLGASACFVGRGRYRGGIAPAAVESMIALMTVDFRGWARDYAALAVGGAPGSAAVAPAIARVAASLAAMGPEAAHRQASTVFGSDLRGWIEELEVPALVIHARGDPLVPLDAARYLRCAWPHSALEVLPVASHFPHLTAPEQVIRVLTRHLKGVQPA